TIGEPRKPGTVPPSPKKKGAAPPAPPDAEIPPGTLYETREPSRMPPGIDDDGSEASLMRNDDDEDLEAAFIQTSHKQGSDVPGRAPLAKAKAWGGAGLKSGRNEAATDAAKAKSKAGGSRTPRTGRVDSD